MQERSSEKKTFKTETDLFHMMHLLRYTLFAIRLSQNDCSSSNDYVHVLMSG